MGQWVSCVIPAYNEASRIAAVLRVVTAHPLIGDVIVVDDGSGDGTERIASSFEGVRVLHQNQNRGKTQALAAGLAVARGPHVLLLDADLSGLRARHLTDLILPVLEDRADISISLRRNAPRLWHLIGIDYISGERVLRAEMLKDQLRDLGRLPRFGFEVWLNRLCIRCSARVAVVRWAEVESPLKNRKYGPARGVMADLRMMADIFRSASPLELARQIQALRRLRVRDAPGVQVH
jgi:glycosyltransferase involved in cell wall biosynthesis